MNNDRRKKLERAAGFIADAKGLVEDAKNLIEEAKGEEEESKENLPESLQEGEKGQAMDENIGYLESAADNLDSAIGELNNIQ